VYAVQDYFRFIDARHYYGGVGNDRDRDRSAPIVQQQQRATRSTAGDADGTCQARGVRRRATLSRYRTATYRRSELYGNNDKNGNYSAVQWERLVERRARRSVVSWERRRQANRRRYDHSRHRSATVVLVMVAPSNRRAASFYSVARQWLWETRHGWKWKHRLIIAGAERKYRSRTKKIHGNVDSTKHQEQSKQCIFVIF